MAEPAFIDAHVHLWDPRRISYPWLAAHPPLHRPFTLADLDAETRGAEPRGIVLVEADCAPAAAAEETRFALEMAAGDGRVLAIVARADPSDPPAFAELLDRYERAPLVKGIRQNIQGQPAGFCLQPEFVEGVREVGRRGLTFDLCATHDQLHEVVVLAERCPDTRLVLDHFGKPPIAARRLDPWRARTDALAALPHLHCKFSGLLTEAGPAGWQDTDLLPYVEHVAGAFGPERLIYGGDWPVVRLAGTYREWYLFTRRFTQEWSDEARSALYRDNALRFYNIAPTEVDV